MKNKKILKNLLATASALAVISSGASALADDYVVAGGAAATAANANFHTGGNAAAAAPVVGVANTYYLSNDIDFNSAFTVQQVVDLYGGDRVITITAANLDVKVVNNFDGATQTKVTAVKGAAVAVGGKAGNARATINLGGAVDFDLKDYSNIGVIDFNNNAKVISLSQDKGVLDTVLLKSTGGANGTISITANETTFKAVTVDGAAKIDHVEVQDNKSLTLDTGTDLTNANAALQVKGAGKLFVKNNAKAGNIAIVNGGSVDINADAAAAGKITVADAGKVFVDGANSVVAEVALNHAAATLNLSAGTVAVVSTNGNDGVVNVKGNSTIGKLGAAGNSIVAVNLSNDATLTLGAGAAHFAKAIKTAKNGEGTIVLGAEDLTVETVGAKDFALKAIDVTSDKTVFVTGKDFYSNVTVATGQTKGTVVFSNALTVNGVLGSGGGVLSKVMIDGANANVVLGDLGQVVEVIFTDNAAKATLNSAVKSDMKISANAAGNGILVLTNEKAMTLDSIGAGNALAKVVLAKGDLTLTKDSGIQALEFTADNRVTVTKTNGITGIKTANAGQGAISFSAGSDLNAVFNAADKKGLKELRYTGTGAAILDMKGQNVYGTNVVADKPEVLSLTNVGAVDGVYGGFGTADARLAALTFGAVGGNGATVNGEVYSNAITTAATKVKFMKSLYGKDDKTEFTLGAGDITFADGVNFTNMRLNGVAAKLTFEGSTNVGFISADTVTFAAKADSVRNLSDDITAATGITMNEGTYNFVGGKTVTGPVTTNKAVLNLGAGKTTFGDITAADTTTVNLTDRTSQFYGAKVDTTKTNFNVSAVVLDGDEMKNAIHFTAAKTSKIAVGSGNRFNTFTTKDGSGPDDLTVVGSVNKGFVDSFKNVNEASKKLLEAFASNGVKDYSSTAYKLLNLVAGNTITDTKGSEALNRMTSTSTTAAVASDIATMAMSSVADRISSIGHIAAPAAGEEDEAKFGVWGQAFGSRATQKARKSDAGYKANAVGGTVGADTMVSENTMLGFATTYAKSDVKFKDFKDGDKAKLTNMFFNLYAKHDLGNNWFVQGATNFGKGEVKSDAKRVTGATTYDVASAKYDTMAFGMEAKVGYNVRVADATMLVPTLGLAYVNVNEAGFSEKGSAFNRTVTKKAADKFTATLGTAVQGNMDMNGMEFAPEAHAYVNYDLKAKAAKADIRIDGLTNAVSVTAAKAAKVSYNLGTSLNAKSGMVNYGVGYDAKLSEKFVAHQGTFRVRVDL